MILGMDMEAMILGKHSNLASLFGVSEEAADLHADISVDGDACLRHFSFTEPLSSQLNLLKCDAEATFLLLPEAELDAAKGEDYQRLLALLPALHNKPNVYLFPYGRCAMQLALRQATKLFMQTQTASIQVLALHLDPRLSAPASSEPSASIASQCFMACRLYPATHGFVIPWADYEVQTSDKSLLATTRALIQRFRKQCGEQLMQCYLPSAVGPELIDAWMNSVEQFQTSLSQRSQIVFADAKVGDLGVCSGLYNLYHSLVHYQRNKHSGYSFQLELSNNTYRSAMLLRWEA